MIVALGFYSVWDQFYQYFVCHLATQGDFTMVDLSQHGTTKWRDAMTRIRSLEKSPD